MYEGELLVPTIWTLTLPGIMRFIVVLLANVKNWVGAVPPIVTLAGRVLLSFPELSWFPVSVEV